jgi:hypothetical protein
MRIRPPAPRHVTPPTTTRRAGGACFIVFGLAMLCSIVIHNIGAGTRMEDRLFAYPITGHYRYPAARQDNSR